MQQPFHVYIGGVLSMSKGHNEAELAHWGIRWETIRLHLAQHWNLDHIIPHAEYNLQHWQARQNHLFQQAQKESMP